MCLGAGAPFAALNAAFCLDVIAIRVAARVVVDAPIHVLFVTTPGADRVMAPARLVVTAGERSQLTLVESYAGISGTGRGFTNAVTDVVLGESAVVDHYKLQREAADGYHVAAMFVDCARSATFASQSIVAGGAIVRNDVFARLGGEGAECTLNGLYLAGGEALVDNHTSIDHAMPHCPSHEVYKGILSGRAKAVFNGKITVRPDAQKTDAKQTNKALLLSDDASINTKPQLEIFADDVKCTHGAAIGQLDEDALFYCRARGIAALVTLFRVGAARHLAQRQRTLAQGLEHDRARLARRGNRVDHRDRRIDPIAGKARATPHQEHIRHRLLSFAWRPQTVRGGRAHIWIEYRLLRSGSVAGRPAFPCFQLCRPGAKFSRPARKPGTASPAPAPHPARL